MNFNSGLSGTPKSFPSLRVGNGSLASLISTESATSGSSDGSTTISSSDSLGIISLKEDGSNPVSIKVVMPTSTVAERQPGSFFSTHNLANFTDRFSTVSEGDNSIMTKLISLTETTTEAAELNTYTFQQAAEKPIDDIGPFLSTNLSISVEAELGRGANGVVYKAASGFEQYALKIELYPAFKSISTGKFWRESDFATIRADVRNMAKPLAFIVAVRENENSPITYHYVPAEKSKEFGQQLQREQPHAEIAVQGQLMPLITGTDLEVILSKEKKSFPAGSQFLKNLINGCYSYMEDAFYVNLLNLDIKPDNIMCAEDGTPKIIDLGSAYRGAARYTKEGVEKTATKKGTPLTNPTEFKKIGGTESYISPQVAGYVNHAWSDTINQIPKTDKAYRSNVDAYSFALTFLKSISPTEFKIFEKANEENAFKDIEPEKYLETYLQLVGSESNTAKELEANPKIKELFNLTFQLSGDNGTAVFPQLQKAFHEFQRENGYTEKTVFRGPATLN